MKNIHIVFGSQGAGKSTYSKKLAEKENGIHLSIDDWMSELFEPDLPQPMNFNWIMERVKRCEKIIWLTTSKIIRSGGVVILDLGFMKISDRKNILALAEKEKFMLGLHYLNAPRQIRLERVLSRNKEKGEIFSFEVTPEMFNFMETQFESPTENELEIATIFESN